MAISGTKGQGWRAIPTQYRKASEIYTAWPPFYSAKKHKKLKRNLNLRTPQICAHIIVYNFRTQHSTEQFWKPFLLTFRQTSQLRYYHWAGRMTASSLDCKMARKENIQPTTMDNKPNARCKRSKVMVPNKPSNQGNQQCLCRWLGRGVGLWESLTFDPTHHARDLLSAYWQCRFVGAKFYCPRGLAGINYQTAIKEKITDFATTVITTPYLHCRQYTKK